MRKFIAMIVLFTWIIIWIIIATIIGGYIVNWPKWIVLIYYIFAGIAWVIPIKPLFAWMNTPQE